MGNALIWMKRPQELPCNIPEQKGNRSDKEYIGGQTAQQMFRGLKVKQIPWYNISWIGCVGCDFKKIR